MGKGIIRSYGPSNPALPFMKIISGNPMVVSYLYDWVEQEKIHHNKYKWLFARITDKMVLNSADLVLATTKRLKSFIEDRYGNRVEIIPNFVDEKIFFPNSFKTKKRQIIYIGRLHWLKGLKYLLEAICDFDKNLKTFIVGNGEEEKALKKVSKDLKLKKVNFLGFLQQNKLSTLLRESYALILPTITMEGHPKVIVESFASGVPVIVTDVKGSRELVRNNINGIIVPPKDSKEISKALKRIVEDDNLRYRLSLNSYNESKRYFFIRIMEKENALLCSLAPSSFK